MIEQLKVDGKCYCGEITIDGTVASNMILACHCTDCQIFSGGPFRANAVIPAGSLNITGNVKEYLKVAESGNERIQGFCGQCGSQLYAVDPAKTTYMVRTGCLRQRDQLVPTKHIFGKSTAAWLSSVNQATWVIDGPASEEMKPNSEKP